MKVTIQLKETSQPLHHEACNTYTKDALYCVQLDVNLQKVIKYPLANIWRIVEDYGEHTS